MRQYLILFFCFLFHAPLFSQKKVGSKTLYPVTITFQNQVGNQLLSLDSTYTNAQGENFRVQNFRYYISHIIFTENSGDHTFRSGALPDNYFLVDERKPESKTITLQIPFQKISDIQFNIGVDSSKNVSGVQTGALDPANGMFWTWNSGYIFTKLEGTSPQSKAPGHSFTYHIGGFRSGENAVRFIKLPINKTISTTKPETIKIVCNVNTLLGNIKMAGLPSIMQPGPPAMQMADNYSKMFSVADGSSADK